MSRSQAKQLAAELGYALEIDGPSDKELKQLKGDDELGNDEVPFWFRQPERAKLACASVLTPDDGIMNRARL
jgi:hypothetical protein